MQLMREMAAAEAIDDDRTGSCRAARPPPVERAAVTDAGL